MKTRSSTQAQDPRQWQELATADPAYREWHNQRDAEDQIAFDAWLNTDAGIYWINSLAEEMAEHDGTAIWNHDGFNPEPAYVH